MNDQVVLVTGASEGIGKAAGFAFYEAGARVIFTGRSAKKLKALEKKNQDPARILFYEIDFKNKKSCQQLVNAIVKKWKTIDILINNCGGIEKKGQFLDLDERDWLDAFECNLLTAVTMSKLVIPVMQKNGGGKIVNVSSFTALQPGSFNPHYSAMKSALINFTKHLSSQFAKDRILVNAVSPGHIQTEGWDRYLKEKSLSHPEKYDQIKKNEEERVITGVPLGRFGKPEEVAGLIQYICSDKGNFMTGSNFVIDGGVTRGI